MKRTPDSAIGIWRVLPAVTKDGHADAAQAVPSAGRRTSPREMAGRSAPSQIKVLLVDDHPIIREGIAQILESAGDIALVAEAASGQAAIEAARSMKPDVTLMDVNMPGINGVQAARAIREEEPVATIIALSIYDDEASRQAMLGAGACAYLLKDGPAEILIDTIRRCSPPPRNRR